MSDAERARMLANLVLRRTKLTASEAAGLREVFPSLRDAHYNPVWKRLRRRGLERSDAEDLHQEVFLALYNHILEHGFPDNVPAMLRTVTERRVLNHVRARKRAPQSIALPSSGSEKPGSEPDVDRALDLREMARRLLPRLSPEHRDVVDLVILNGLSHEDAGFVLDISEGTVKSRLKAAKDDLLALAKRFLPPSQRGTS
jgi:RNA polymerase sigma-70 factor (ECF subfamily)